MVGSKPSYCNSIFVVSGMHNLGIKELGGEGRAEG